MKHTKNRLLAVLLVLAMAIGMVPFAALTVGAESAIVHPITVDENRAITDLDWITAYVSSPFNADGKTGQVVKRWSGAYRLSEIVTVPKAGTTLRWTDHVAAGALSEGEYFLTSWKSVGENKWELDLTGANLVAAGLTTNANQFYDAVSQTVTYTYTTTSDNEALRFACYGYKADGELTEGPDECPAVYAYDTTFAEGAVSGATWNLGAIVPEGFGAAQDHTVEGYTYSNPILIPAAGTTLSWNATCTAEAYAITVWRAAKNGTLEFVYGCEGSDEDNAWTKVTVTEAEGEEPVTTYTYSYTSSFDNEFIRICAQGGAPAITCVENNAANHAPILQAAGYDPAQIGTPYMLKWYSGLLTTAGDRFIHAGDDSAYRVSDVLPVYAAGTTVTFTDMVLGEDASADDFADENVYVVARFDGAAYTGVYASKVDTMTAGVMMGDTLENREAALANGKRVYAYTTTETDEYLRLSYCCFGNKVNGGVVAPIIYINAPGEGHYYNALEGLTVYSVWGQETFWGDSYGSDTWLSALAARYGWSYLNVNADTDNGVKPEDADIVVYHTIGVESATDLEQMIGDDYLTVVITDSKELANEIERMNNDYVCAVCVYDLPYRVTGDYEAYNEGYMNLYAPETHLNAAGHTLLLPWMEAVLGDNYHIFDGIVEEGAPVIRFVNDNIVMGVIGTASGERTFTVPAAPTGVYADNMFGWVGTLTAADGTEGVRIFAAGEKVTVPQGASGVFAPLYMDMAQQSGADLHMEGEIPSLRFLAKVSEADYKNVLAMIADGKLGEATVTLGMLIVPDQYLTELDGVLTHASLAASELDSANVTDVTSNVVADEDGALNWYDFDGTDGYVAGTLSRVRSSDQYRRFTARGYAKLTVNGVDYYIYADNSKMKSVSVYEKAMEALNDCYPRAKEGYPNEVDTVKGKMYSPYTEAQRTVLKSLVQGVAEIKTVIDSDTGMLTAELVRGEYYDANIRRECYTVVGGGSDALTDIFYENAPGTKKQFAVQSADWNAMLQALGDDGTGVDAICVITVARGYDFHTILQGDLELEVVEFTTADGTTCYLIGFSSHTPFH